MVFRLMLHVKSGLEMHVLRKCEGAVERDLIRLQDQLSVVGGVLLLASNLQSFDLSHDSYISVTGAKVEVVA